jgi:Asp-tRNA(Asn)/Glu-tRNA(Gln) amidotransferase A subunit family amidase
MALSWTMDKIGPLCRTAEDCALVLRAICGPDGKDASVIGVPFNWNAAADARKLRAGYVKAAFEGEIPDDPKNPERSARAREIRKFDQEALGVVRSLGIDLKPIELPKMAANALDFILTAEATAAFDDLIRSEKLDLMSAEPERSRWVESFRLHRFVPAVEYIQANRARHRLMEDYAALYKDLDLFVGSALSATNLTGHPEVSLPHGFDAQGQPTSLRLTGKLFGETEILLLAHVFQQNTGHHLKRPQI